MSQESKKQLFWLDGHATVPAFQFNQDNYACADVGSPNGKAALSFGGWFKLIQRSPSNVWLPCGWSQTGSWGSTHIRGSDFRFGTGSTSSHFGYSFGGLPENVWIHCIASYDGQTCKFFLNGQQTNSHETGTLNLVNNDTQFRIASYNEGSLKYCTCAACNVFVLDRGVDSSGEASRIMAMKSIASLKSDSSLVDAWPIDKLEDGNFFASIVGRHALKVIGTAVQIEGPLI